jgi:hypothetical protein
MLIQLTTWARQTDSIPSYVIRGVEHRFVLCRRVCGEFRLERSSQLYCVALSDVLVVNWTAGLNPRVEPLVQPAVGAVSVEEPATVVDFS